jgi:hypothetical protein
MTTKTLSLPRRAPLLLLVAGALVIPLISSRSFSKEEENPGTRRPDQPGSRVKWVRFSAQNQESSCEWGDFLTDIARHLPSQYGKKYYSDDRITHAHETTHGINSHLSNHPEEIVPGRRGHGPIYGFYVGHDQAVILTGPRIKLSEAAAMVPSSLRGARYQLYCIDQQKYFEDYPLYLFDEWVAYINGATAGVELTEKKQLEMPRNDALVAPLEFSIYALALTAAIQKHDPDYLRENNQYLEFLAHELRRATRIYRRGMKLDQFRWEQKLEHNLLRQDDSRELREIVRQVYGDDLKLEELLGG